MKQLGLGFILVVSLILSAVNAFSDTVNICVDSSSDLIIALDEAAGSTDDYVIQVVKGTYTGEFVYSSSNTSNLIIEGGWSSIAADCDEPDPAPNPADTILDGTNSTRVLGIVSTGTTSPANISIEGLTLHNGVGSYAGGLYVKLAEGNVTVDNCVISDNTSSGGAYITTSGSVTVSNNHIINNSRSGSGAGLQLYMLASTGDISVENNIITGNLSNNSGGGLWVYSGSRNVRIVDNTISYNSSKPDSGGGMHVAAQGVLIENNLISHNTGGGIYSLPWWTSIQYNITEIKNNTILHSIDGPGIRFEEISSANRFFDELNIINNVIAYNASDHVTRGGGIHLSGSNIGQKTALINNTITSNSSSGDGGGIKFETGVEDHDIHFSSNIIVNNTGSGLGHDIYIDNDTDGDLVYAPLTMLNNNFDQSGTGFFAKEPAYALTLDPSNLDDQDPLFVNSGTDSFHLSGGSPCIDTGNNDAPELPVYDRDGEARIMDGIVDMGAYEHLGAILPVALFSVDATAGMIPLTVNFIDESLGTVTNWAWDFGDGGLSSEQNPSHTYTEEGSYTVSLAVTGPNGSTVEIKADLIAVALTPPTAVAGPDQAINRDSIVLDGSNSNDVDGNIVSYEWTLNHREEPAYNHTASGIDPEVSGLQQGIYDVELEVTDNDSLRGTDTFLLSVVEPLDVNSDGVLGLEEVIYILNVLTEN